jgi:ribosomal protein S18 acetylase RimI-like enzyme
MSDLTTRPIRYADDGTPHPADLATAVRVISECDLAAIGELDSGAADIAHMLRLPTMDRAASCLVLEADQPIGLAWVENDVTGRDTFIDVFCPPGPRAREVHDVGLELGLEAGRGHRAVAAADGDWTARAGCWLADVDYAAALTDHGFTPSRTFYRMRIESSSPDLPDVMPPLPPGVEIVVSDDEAMRRRVWAVDNASFAEHYNFSPRDFDEWSAYWSSSSTQDPEGWWLLTVDGVDAAICLLDESRAELGDGYVAVLGVLTPFRGRGLARLLLRRAFVRYRDLGRAGTQLGVDAENATGAVRVYESVGMRVTRAVQGFSQPIG